jgi:isochorismate synthase
MITSEEFCSLLEDQLNSKLPFVAYRKPNQVDVKAILQPTNKVYYADDFSESGFVLSPFDSRKKAVLIPISSSKLVSISSGNEFNTQEFEGNIYKDLSDKDEHLSLVSKAINSIESGELKKVVVSRIETLEINDLPVIEIFKRLLKTYQNAFVYCWYHPKIGIWLGATPETLIKIEGNQFETMALAGTQNYCGKLDVIWGDKEKEEQQFVTDYIIDNLKENSNTLKISEVETFKAGNVLHLLTRIKGTFDHEKHKFKIFLNGLHPTPAICGIPRLAAYQFIINNENYNREYYTGFLGELNLKEKITRNSNRRNVENNAYSTVKKVSDLYVNLRCMQIKNNKAFIYVGGGITKSSDPEKEWIETINKSETIKKVLT